MTIQDPDIEVLAEEKEVAENIDDSSLTNRPVIENKISFEDFAKVEMKIGKIISADILEKSERLLKLTVDFGEDTGPRQVISGIRMQFPDPSALLDNEYVFVTNLKPREILGLESQAMILAAADESGMALMSPTIKVAPGTSLS